jgi:hypothetical protein
MVVKSPSWLKFAISFTGIDKLPVPLCDGYTRGIIHHLESSAPELDAWWRNRFWTAVQFDSATRIDT